MKKTIWPVLGSGFRVMDRARVRYWSGSRFWFTCIYVELLDATVRGDHPEAPRPSRDEDGEALLVAVEVLILQVNRGRNPAITVKRGLLANGPARAGCK